MRNYLIFCLAIFSIFQNEILAQEGTIHIGAQKIGHIPKQSITEKGASLNLPFFDDFTVLDGRPNTTYWVAESNVFINNHLPFNPITRGVATFDANDKFGTPYDTVNAYHKLAADSLTSQDIDLSNLDENDNVYLSFFYQAGGWGYQPKDEDSLQLFFKNNLGIWVKTLSIDAAGNDSFQENYIKIEDTQFFHDAFAFKFVNIATKGIGNSHWHIDYVRLDKNRSTFTPLNDIAFVATDATILQNFTAMPYRHFAQNKNAHFNNNLAFTLKNNSNSSENITVSYKATASDGTNLGTGNKTVNIAANSRIKEQIPLYAASVHNPANVNDTFYYNHQLSFEDPNEPNGHPNNTIHFQQAFENYYAYDDGSAEKAYYINMHPSYNIPALNAIHFNFQIADSLRGLAIYFTKEAPLPRNKEFAIRVYTNIAINGGQDVLLHEEQFLYPAFSDTINQFTIYKFEKPVAVKSGSNYITLVQLAGGFSDSLFIGLDLHDTNKVQQRFINTTGTWEPSAIKGALMIRPLLGDDFTILSTTNLLKETMQLYPNPAQNFIHLDYNIIQPHTYKIYNQIGQLLRENKIAPASPIDISGLPAGLYLFQLINEKNQAYPIMRFIKTNQ